MPAFVDMHCHTLFGVDDGASCVQEMHDMLSMAYDDGIRKICMTPHFDPQRGEVPVEKIKEAFAVAEEYCHKNLPDMSLCLGNELSYHIGCVEPLVQGKCLTLAGSRYVLVDFLSTFRLVDLKRGISALLNSGYIPIIAHVERYGCLMGKVDEVRAICEEGALIQVNANSLWQGRFTHSGSMVRKLLTAQLVDMIASDAHDAFNRPPFLSIAYKKVCNKYGEGYADALFSTNPERVLSGARIR